jgi:heme-degrading monooxygenase HmoA
VIARRWRVWTARERADELEPYLRRTGVGEALRTPGNQGALLLRADGCDGHVEFTLLTFWTSWAAITAFAGDDVSKAVLYPEDHAYFTKWDEHVQHLAVASGQPPCGSRTDGMEKTR